VEIKITTAGGPTPTLTAPDGQTIAVTQQIAKRIIAAIADGEENVPQEFADAAKEVLRNAAGHMERTVVTDSAGHFTIPDIPPGNISITAQRRGYFGPMVNGLHPTLTTETTTIKEGQTSAVRLSMVAGGTISGRVFDPNGKPLIDELVHVRRPDYENGALSRGLASIKLTDERGEYRASGIPPGEYYVMAIARRPIRTEGVPIPTLYPGTTDLTTATRVRVGPDDEISGIDIRIRAETAGTVRGKVLSSLPAGPVIGPRGQVRPSIASVTLVRGRSTAERPEAM
jgi:hypothetical protein